MLTEEFGLVVINVGYRLALEFPFLAGVDDCWDSLVNWCSSYKAAPFSFTNQSRAQASQKYTSIQVNPALGFIIGGDSSGAMASSTIALRARDANLSLPLTGYLLILTSVIHPKNVPEKYKEQYISSEQNKDAPFFFPT